MMTKKLKMLIKSFTSFVCFFFFFFFNKIVHFDFGSKCLTLNIIKKIKKRIRNKNINQNQNFYKYNVGKFYTSRFNT